MFSDFEMDIAGMEIAADFVTFVEQLFNWDDEYAYGFVTEDTAGLKEALEQSLRSIPYRLRPNKHKLPEPVGFQTNLEFPLHPECEWVLEVPVAKEQQDALEAALAEVRYEAVTLHIPPWDKLDL